VLSAEWAREPTLRLLEEEVCIELLTAGGAAEDMGLQRTWGCRGHGAAEDIMGLQER
jgi:hypothetical protein